MKIHLYSFEVLFHLLESCFARHHGGSSHFPLNAIGAPSLQAVGGPRFQAAPDGSFGMEDLWLWYPKYHYLKSRWSTDFI